MKLTKKQIESITRGALSLVEDADGRLHFRRFEEKQKEYFVGVSNYERKVFSSAGMRFDFYTDSDYIELEYSRGIYYNLRKATIDTYADGAFVHCENIMPDCDAVRGYRALFAARGKKRVTVYLPQTLEFVLHSLSLSDGALIEPYYEYTKKVLICGDSITQGYYSEYSSLSYTNRLAKYFEWDILNQAVAGYWFRPNWIDGNINFAPELITVAYGTNDWIIEERMDSFERNAEGFFASLADAFPNVPVAVLLPIWRKDENIDNFCTFEELGAKIAEIACAYANVRVINSYKFVPHLPEFFVEDGLHPNSLGHAEYARGVAGELLKFGL